MRVLQHNSVEFVQQLDKIQSDLEDFGFDSIMPIPLVLDKLNRNEMIIIQSDTDNYVIGYTGVVGVTRVFHFFWCAGKAVIEEFESVCQLIKNGTNSKKITFVANSEIHNRLYDRMLRAYNPYKTYHFSIDI
mgnify:FL=1